MQGETERGKITWMCSEEEGWPDCGVIVGLGDGRALHMAEMADATIKDLGGDPGEYGGWTIAFYDRKDGYRLVGSVGDECAAKALSDILAGALLTSSRPVAAPAQEGAWRMVPVEPEPEMVGAFWKVKNTGSTEPGQTGDDRSDYAAYRAMLSAAPSPVIDEDMIQRGMGAISHDLTLNSRASNRIVRAILSAALGMGT